MRRESGSNRRARTAVESRRARRPHAGHRMKPPPARTVVCSRSGSTAITPYSGNTVTTSVVKLDELRRGAAWIVPAVVPRARRRKRRASGRAGADALDDAAALRLAPAINAVDVSRSADAALRPRVVVVGDIVAGIRRRGRGYAAHADQRGTPEMASARSARNASVLPRSKAAGMTKAPYRLSFARAIGLGASRIRSGHRRVESVCPRSDLQLQARALHAEHRHAAGTADRVSAFRH